MFNTARKFLVVLALFVFSAGQLCAHATVFSSAPQAVAHDVDEQTHCEEQAPSASNQAVHDPALPPEECCTCDHAALVSAFPQIVHAAQIADELPPFIIQKAAILALPPFLDWRHAHFGWNTPPPLTPLQLKVRLQN